MRAIPIVKLLPCLLLVATGALSSCVNPQQVDLLEREQRRLRADMNTLHSDVDGFRSTLADTRANIQQIQRDLSAIKERIDETRVQVGRQIGQTSKEGDSRVKNLEDRLAKLEEDAKAIIPIFDRSDAKTVELRQQTVLAISVARSRPRQCDCRIGPHFSRTGP